jgi:hypothetical protein
MSDRDFDELVEAMREKHNAPPPTPRDRMWERIEAARRARRNVVHLPDRAPRRRPVWRIGLSAAAVLLLGIAIGRMTLPPGAPPEVADAGSTSPATAPAAAAGRAPRDETTALVRHAAVDLFDRADVLLTGLKVAACGDRELAPVPAWAGGMLSQTRLLLDSPLADDPEMKNLLLDLELVLARIAGLSREDCARDVDRIRRDIADNATLDRLRLASAGQGAI